MSGKLYLFSLCSLATLLLFTECRKKEKLEPVDHLYSNNLDSEGINYLALGDSYTKAECEVIANSYPNLLVQKFNESGVKVKKQVTIAQTGWRTDNLNNGINQANLKDTFDIVSLLIGVNNQYQGMPVATYRKEFIALLARSISLAQNRRDKVFVISIPDYGMTPYGSSNQAYISGQIDIFNAVNKEVADSMQVKYFDITPISREAKNDPALTCTDNLHPSAKMYKRWVELMYADVLALTQKP